MGHKIAFKQHIEANYKWTFEITQKPESTTGFIPQKKPLTGLKDFRMALAVPFNFRRRLLRDVEKTIFSSESMTQIAFMSLIINGL